MKRRRSTTRRLATTAVVILMVATLSRMFGSSDEQDNTATVFYGASQNVDASNDLSRRSSTVNRSHEAQASVIDTGRIPQQSQLDSAVASTPERNRFAGNARRLDGSGSQKNFRTSNNLTNVTAETAGNAVRRGAIQQTGNRSVAQDDFAHPATIADPIIVSDLPSDGHPQLAADRRTLSRRSERVANRDSSNQVANDNDFINAFAPLASLAQSAGRHGTAEASESIAYREASSDGFGDVQNVALAQPFVEPAEPPVLAQGPSGASQGTTEYRLAEAPKIGDRWKSETPTFDGCAIQSETFYDDFSPDAIDENLPYDPYPNQQVYQGKTLNANQRPLLELGQPWYQLGQLSPGSSILGNHNNVNPQLVVFGDYRQAIASNTVNGDNVSQVAFEMNTFWSLFVTGTERLVTGVSPLDNGGGNTRWLLDEDRFEFEGDFDFDFGYLEGDLGAITGGLIGETLPFDLPFAAGLTPIFIQNGIWLNDAVEGVFATIPARNSPKLNISNMDITFAYIYDQIDSAAFEGDNSAAKAYAMFLFIEALNGYFEIDYAFLEDRDVRDRSYHNIGLAFTRRFGRFISHSTRVIANAGQEVSSGNQTADGLLFLSENSLITRNPYTVIPYFNFFAGFDTPQSFAGDAELVNTGILFESDGMTGYPTLDGRAQDAFGYAIGLNLLAQDFSQQLILETAAVFRNDDSDLPGDQYGVGMRYQLPLTNSWIFRTDAMYGFFRSDDDDLGMRMELRKKF